MTGYFSGDMTKPLFVAGVGLSAWASGAIACMSLVTVPAILNAHNHPSARVKDPSPLLLTQWASVYNIGIRVAPPAVFLSAVCHLANAYIHYAPSSLAAGNAVGGAWGTARSKMFGAAAAVGACIVPFTLLVMAPTNKELFAREAEGKVEVVKTRSRMFGSDKELINKWAMLNLLRSALPALATILAFEAL